MDADRGSPPRAGDGADRTSEDELVRRLSELKWPSPPEGAAERGLKDLKERLDEASSPSAGRSRRGD
jgi:hypothetical protein